MEAAENPEQLLGVKGGSIANESEIRQIGGKCAAL